MNTVYVSWFVSVLMTITFQNVGILNQDGEVVFFTHKGRRVY